MCNRRSSAACMSPAWSRDNGVKVSVYIIREYCSKDSYLKNTSRWQGQTGDCLSEGRLSASPQAVVRLTDSARRLVLEMAKNSVYTSLTY